MNFAHNERPLGMTPEAEASARRMIHGSYEQAFRDATETVEIVQRALNTLPGYPTGSPETDKLVEELRATEHEALGQLEVLLEEAASRGIDIRQFTLGQ